MLTKKRYRHESEEEYKGPDRRGAAEPKEGQREKRKGGRGEKNEKPGGQGGKRTKGEKGKGEEAERARRVSEKGCKEKQKVAMEAQKKARWSAYETAWKKELAPAAGAEPEIPWPSLAEK